MALEARIKRLEETAHPGSLLTRSRCYECGRTDQKIPPDFRGLIIDRVDYRPCSHGSNPLDKSELVPNMRQA